jgi:hypothetical protein
VPSYNLQNFILGPGGSFSVLRLFVRHFVRRVAPRFQLFEVVLEIREGKVSEELRSLAVRVRGVTEAAFSELVPEGPVPRLAARHRVQQPKLDSVLLAHVLDADLSGAQEHARLFPDLYELLPREHPGAGFSAVDAHEMAATVGV